MSAPKYFYSLCFFASSKTGWTYFRSTNLRENQKTTRRAKNVFGQSRIKKFSTFSEENLVISAQFLISQNGGSNAKQAQVRNDSRGVGQTRRGGIQHRSPFRAHAVGQEQHTGPH
jgi:hypothetical protein